MTTSNESAASGESAVPGLSRRVVAAGGLAAGAAALAGCSGSAVGGGSGSNTGGTTGGSTGGGAADNTPFKLGVLHPMSGTFQLPGTEIFRGVELYLEEQGNKLGGRPVELIKADEGDSPDVAKPAIERLVTSDRVHAVVGLVNSASAAAVKPVVMQGQVPLLVTNAGNDNLTKDAKYVFRTSSQNRQGGVAVGMAMEKGGDTFAITSDFAGGKERVEGLREYFKSKGVNIVGEAYPPLGKTNDFQPYMNQILAKDPKQVFAFFGGADTIKFITQYADFGLAKKYPLYMEGVTLTDPVVNRIGDKAVGVKGAITFSNTQDTPEAKKFTEAFTKKYKEAPSCNSEFAYVAMMVLDRAVKAAGAGADGAKLAAAIEGVGDIDAPRGKMRIGKESHTAEGPWYPLDLQRKGDRIVSVLGPKLGDITVKYS